jgi:catechol 2,3-dioxygenase-like lactoylglutathione lyase family enzyme
MEPRISIVTLGVRDMPLSFRFYRDGLGFSTKGKDSDPIAFFATTGTRLAIFPIEKLAEDIGPAIQLGSGFSGITLAHNVRNKEEVSEVLKLAEKAGGRIVKHAQDVFWGGHSGYFSDPDGYFWEVAWSPRGAFDENGVVVL